MIYPTSFLQVNTAPSHPAPYTHNDIKVVSKWYQSGTLSISPRHGTLGQVQLPPSAAGAKRRGRPPGSAPARPLAAATARGGGGSGGGGSGGGGSGGRGGGSLGSAAPTDRSSDERASTHPAAKGSVRVEIMPDDPDLPGWTVVQHHNKSNNRKWKMFHGPNGQPKVKSRAVAMRVQYGEGAGKHPSRGGAPLPPPPRARPPAAAAAAVAASAAASSSSYRGRARDSSHSDGSEDEAAEQWENYTHLLGSRSTTPPPRASAPGAATSKARAAGARDHGAMHGGGGGLAAPLPVARAPAGASAPPSWLKGFLAGH